MNLTKILGIALALASLVSLQTVFAEGNFNLEVELPSQYSTAFVGEKIHFTVKVVNLDNLERMDITLEYKILEDGEEVMLKRETVAIETQASFVGEVLIPEKSPEGSSILQVRIIGENEEILSEGQVKFFISERPGVIKFILKNKWEIIISFAVLIFVLTIFLSRKKIKDFFEKRKIKSKVSDIIDTRIKSGKMTKDRLKHAVIPKKKIVEISDDELIY